MSDQKMADLRAKGWTVVPFDDPERAMRGFVASKEGEQEQHFSWPMFEGGEYQMDYKVVHADELALFIMKHHVLKCDDPMNRRLGFVWYDHERRVAVVRRCTLTDFRNASESTRAAIEAARD